MMVKCSICMTEIYVTELPQDEFGNFVDGFFCCNKCSVDSFPSLSMDSGDLIFEDEDVGEEEDCQDDSGEYGLGGNWWKF